MFLAILLCTDNGCTPGWTSFLGMHSLGLTLQDSANSYTQDSCQAACFASKTCQSIDFNYLDRTCFFGTLANPSTNTNLVVNHFNLVRNCGTFFVYFVLLVKINLITIVLILDKINLGHQSNTYSQPTTNTTVSKHKRI